MTHRTRVKICGVTTVDDALTAARAGADAVGMILAAPGDSPRLIDGEVARAIARELPPLVTRVGVFVDASPAYVAQCVRNLPLDLVQLHGRETPDRVKALSAFRVVKAVRPDEIGAWASLSLPNLVGLLVDGVRGGSGEANDWDAVEQALRRTEPTMPVFLAGGLTPETVAAVVRRFRPFAVDVSSGVEGEVKGRKSAVKVRAFVENAIRMQKSE